MAVTNDVSSIYNGLNSTPTLMTAETSTQIACANDSTPGNTTLPPCQSESNVEDNSLRNIFSVIVSTVVAIIMIGIGCAVEIKMVARHFRNPTGILTGLACQFGIMPVLAYAWARIFTLDGPETLAILVVGSCPGGTMSNIIAFWVGGDMELSATMTTVSVTVSLGMLPLLMYIYSTAFDQNDIAVPFSTIGTTLALIIVPLAIGSFLRFKFPRIADKILKICGLFGMLALFVVGGLSIYMFHSHWSFHPSLLIIALLYPFCGMVLGYSISSIVSLLAKPLRLTHGQRRTVSVETGIQNQQVAMSIIQLAGWPVDITGRMVVLPMMYSISQLLWSIIFISLFHIVSLARNGKCPQLKKRNGQDGTEDEEKKGGDDLSTVAKNIAFEEKE